MVALGGGLRSGHISLILAVSSGKSALWRGEFSHAALMQAAVNTKPSQLLIEMKAQVENDEGIQSLRRIQLFNRKTWAAIGWHNRVLQPPPDYIDTGKGLHIPDY